MKNSCSRSTCASAVYSYAAAGGISKDTTVRAVTCRPGFAPSSAMAFRYTVGP